LIEKNIYERNSHSNTVRSESPSGSLVLKSTIVILSTHILELGVVLERVYYAFAFDGVRTLHIIVVGEKKLFGTMELSATPNGLFGSVVPPHTHLHVVPVVLLDLLHARHVRGLGRVRWPHQNAITGCSTKEPNAVNDNPISKKHHGQPRKHGKEVF